MNEDFRRIIDYNLFVVRINRSSPTVWQRHPQGHQLLFVLPPPFVDSYPTLQEWELNTHDGSQCIRLDFLNRIALPPTTPFESPAYFDRLRWATLGGFHQTMSKEIQRFHVVDTVLSRDEGYQLLRNENFYHRPQPEDWTEYLTARITHTPEVSPRVVVHELLDQMEAIPTANLTVDAVTRLHDLRVQRHLRQHSGMFFLKKFNLPKFVPFRHPTTTGSSIDSKQSSCNYFSIGCHQPFQRFEFRHGNCE